MQVARLLRRDEVLHELVVLREHEAEAHAGRYGLGEGAVDDAVGELARADVGELAALEAQLSVGVVLDKHGVVLVEELAYRVAALLRVGEARRVLEVRHGVGELDALLERRLELVEL